MVFIWKLPRIFCTVSTSGTLGPTSCVAHVRILHRTVCSVFCILPLGYVVYIASLYCDDDTDFEVPYSLN